MSLLKTRKNELLDIKNKYKKSDFGIWIVYSPSTLNDNKKVLCELEGVYSDILDYVLSDSFDGFYIEDLELYGTISKGKRVKMVDGDTLKRKEELLEKKEYLESELKKVTDELELL